MKSCIPLKILMVDKELFFKFRHRDLLQFNQNSLDKLGFIHFDSPDETRVFIIV